MATGATIAAESAGEKFVRPDSCPFCKTLIGNISYTNTIHSLADVIIAVNSCDQIRRTAEVVSNSLNKDVLQIQFPITYTSSSRKYFISELKILVNALENRSGQKFNFQRALDYHNEQLKASKKMRNLYFSKNISPKNLHLLSILYSISEPKEFCIFLDQIQNKFEIFKSKKTVLVIGSPNLLEDDGLVNILEQHKIHAVQLNSTGLKQFLAPTHEISIKDETSPNNFGEYLIEAFPHIGMRPNIKLYNQIKEVSEIIKADGIIMKSLSFCDLWYTEKVRLKKSFDIPLLTIDTGYGEGSADRIETRIETFLETI